MKYIRLILVLLLTGVFLFLANHLYQRQQYQYSFMSFRLEDATNAVLVPNLDRLVSKLEHADDLETISVNSSLNKGLNKLLEQKTAGFNVILGESCFASYNETDLVVAFQNPDLDFEDITDLIHTLFQVEADYADGELKLSDETFKAQQFGRFTVFSTLDISPNFGYSEHVASNADYLLFNDTSSVDRFILANKRQFKISNTVEGPIRGLPINHSAFIQKVPKNFESITFYGSNRLLEDKNTFFENPGEEPYNWVSDGILILKKDSFELMIAPQNGDRDLRLILEEQTLDAKGDSVQIKFLNIKSFQIMPFISDFDWQHSIPVLSQELKYYTEFENFNVLANSLAAIRWYLSEIQTGNLISSDLELTEEFRLSTPQKCHEVIVNRTDEKFTFETYTWVEKTKRTRTYVQIELGGVKEVKADLREMLLAFSPTHMLPFNQKGEKLVLASNKQNIACLAANESKNWLFPLGGDLIGPPQLIDLENDGIFEIALFLNNQFMVLNQSGKIVAGLSKKMTLPVRGGLCANYDMNYDYRFFIVTDKNIICLNEKGQVVTGWQFKGSDTNLTGEAYYTQVEGKDYLSFKNTQNQVLMLNRRGENRFNNNTISNLPNESSFITGENEETLHKLGFKNQYIYNRYIKDGYTDSVKLDKKANTIKAKWYLFDAPTLVIEEPNRIVLFNAFGYLEQEILKPQNASQFLGVHSTPDIHYVFFNNTNNSLYLLNEEGKMILDNISNKSEVYGIDATHFYTFDEQKLIEYKLN